MNNHLLIASILLFIVAIGHSVLGEMLILNHLKKVTGLPYIFKSDAFAKNTIRFVWHVTSAIGLALAGILFCLCGLEFLNPVEILMVKIIAASMFVSFLLSLIIARGKHLSWIAFLAIGVLCLMGIM